MDRISKALLMPLPWAWDELQEIDPEPSDWMYVAQRMPRNSHFHEYCKKIVDEQMDANDRPRGIYYPTLLKILAVAISAF